MEGDVVTSFRESIEISAPPQVVWDLITDIRRHVEFAGPKSITKVIDFDGPVAVGSRWVAHEKFGPQKFDAPSEITVGRAGEAAGVDLLPTDEREESRQGRPRRLGLRAESRQRWHQARALHDRARAPQGRHLAEDDVQALRATGEAGRRRTDHA